MAFYSPLFLLLGAASLVPLLLHLLRRRTGARVEFPAVRYLERAEREHSRSLRMRNLLLMLLRVAIVLAIALAAARPVTRWLGRGRAPTAVAIVFDNSASTQVVVEGRALAERLRDEARRLVAAASADDRLWLVTADGTVTAGTAASLGDALHRTPALDGAGDLAGAVRAAASAVNASGLEARHVVVLTDGQRTAWRDAREPRGVPLLVWTPAGAPPPNRSAELAEPRPARWTPRGVLAVRVRSSAPRADSVPYRIVFVAGDGTERVLARGTVAAGDEAQVRSAPPERGWVRGRMELESDELAADDVRHFALWVGPPPAVQLAPGASPFMRSAVEVLAASGRIVAGGGVFAGPADELRGRTGLVTAPSSPVRLGAANRALERAGIPWRFGAPRAESLRVRGAGPGRSLDGTTVTLRYPLLPQAGAVAETLATVGREPWTIAGDGYVVVGSPLVPEATSLPVRAAFIPWLEELLTARLGGEGGGVLHAAPGESVRRPAWVGALRLADGRAQPLSQAAFPAPWRAGSYPLLDDGRVAGMLVVNAEREESVLDRWSASQLSARLGSDVRAANGPDWTAIAFRPSATRSLLVPLLILVLMLVVVEGAIAGAAPRRPPA